MRLRSIEIAELYLAGRKDDAAAKVPRGLIEQMALIGPREKMRDDLERWRESIVTTMLISGDAATIRTAAELVLGCGAEPPTGARGRLRRIGLDDRPELAAARPSSVHDQRARGKSSCTR